MILLSPLLGIHIHHEVNSSGNQSIIHSYLWEDHNTDHPPVSTPPESLPEHISSSGMAGDLGSWDIGIVAVFSGLSRVLDTHSLGFLAILIGFILLNYNVLKFRDNFSIKIFVCESLYRLSNLKSSQHSSEFLFYLPPPQS